MIDLPQLLAKNSKAEAREKLTYMLRMIIIQLEWFYGADLSQQNYQRNIFNPALKDEKITDGQITKVNDSLEYVLFLIEQLDAMEQDDKQFETNCHLRLVRRDLGVGVSTVPL